MSIPLQCSDAPNLDNTEPTFTVVLCTVYKLFTSLSPSTPVAHPSTTCWSSQWTVKSSMWQRGFEDLCLFCEIVPSWWWLPERKSGQEFTTTAFGSSVYVSKARLHPSVSWTRSCIRCAPISSSRSWLIGMYCKLHIKTNPVARPRNVVGYLRGRRSINAPWHQQEWDLVPFDLLG